MAKPSQIKGFKGHTGDALPQGKKGIQAKGTTSNTGKTTSMNLKQGFAEKCGGKSCGAKIGNEIPKPKSTMVNGVSMAMSKFGTLKKAFPKATSKNAPASEMKSRYAERARIGL